MPNKGIFDHITVGISATDCVLDEFGVIDITYNAGALENNNINVFKDILNILRNNKNKNIIKEYSISARLIK